MCTSMTNTLRQLWNNLSSLILSLLLALVVWIAATLQADSFDTVTFPGVPVAPLSQPENTIFFEGEATTVNVEVRAQETVLAALTNSDFLATMDLALVEPGVSTSVPISVTSTSEAVRIQSYDPQQQVVLLEEVRAISLPIQIDIRGQVATGYQAERPTVTPSQVTVQGPLPYLTEVVSVTGFVNVGSAREDVVETVPVAPRDAAGRLVAGLQWSPDQAEVSIDVRRRVGYKPDVEVIPDVRGEPAPGYRKGSVAVEPSTVTLAGTSAVLEQLPAFVETQPVSITGQTEDLIASVPLSVPTNVVVVGGTFVTVKVEILPIVSSRTMTSTVEVQGLRQGWVAALSPDEVDVILEGPDAELAELTTEDIQAFVNLFGYSLGVYRIEPVVLSPEGIRVASIIPETVEVDIHLAPTPTPTATVTAEEP